VAPGSSAQVPDEVRVTQKKAHVSSLFFFWNVNLPPVRSSIASFFCMLRYLSFLMESNKYKQLPYGTLHTAFDPSGIRHAWV
jgi:hypothetical protein